MKALLFGFLVGLVISLFLQAAGIYDSRIELVVAAMAAYPFARILFAK